MQASRQSSNRETLAQGQTLTPEFKQDGQCRGVEATQAAGIHDHILTGLRTQALYQHAQASIGLGVCQLFWQNQHIQPFLALALLRSVSVVIKPLRPLALISWANWLR